jgi:hypothetical protein
LFSLSIREEERKRGREERKSERKRGREERK